MGTDPRFEAWIEQWPSAIVEAGGDESALRQAHEILGPAAVAAGQAVIAEWLQGLDGSLPDRSAMSVRSCQEVAAGERRSQATSAPTSVITTSPAQL